MIMACLCAPTSHEGSFRCRFHRAANPTTNPPHLSPNHPIKLLNYSINPAHAASNQLGCIARESSSSSTAQPQFDDHVTDAVRFSHTPHTAAADQHSIHTRGLSSSSPSDAFRSSLSSSGSSSSSSSSSSTSPRSLTSPKSPAFRSSSFSYASLVYTSSSSSSSRSSASSSSPSPPSPFYCARPPPPKRPSSLSSLPSKCSYRVSPSPSSGVGAGGMYAPSASHAAALAIMKQHSHSKHGFRIQNRNALSPTAAAKIGPSRLSRMAVACAEDLPLLKEEQYISNSSQNRSAPDTYAGSFADAPVRSGFASFEAAQIGLTTRSAVNKFKQSESSCRIVGSKGGSLIRPTVY